VSGDIDSEFFDIKLLVLYRLSYVVYVIICSAPRSSDILKDKTCN